jgi:ATP-dependent Lon protease
MLAPLIDRIEVINVPAYLPIEKLNIAKNYIMPLLEQEYGFKYQPTTEEVVSENKEKLTLTDAAIMEII